MGEPGPEQLLAGLADGQEAAFAALYRLFGERLFRTALTLVGNSSDAEDVVQEVFVALVRSRSGLRQVNNLAAYLFAALRHAAGRLLERRAREPNKSFDVVAIPVTADRSSSSAVDQLAERRVWMRKALERLPVEQREIIALKIDGGLTFAEIAEVLCISPNTVASRYRYALEKLRAAAARHES